MKTAVTESVTETASLPELAAELNRELASLQAHERFDWLAERFRGEILVSSSLGLQAAVVLDFARKHAPEVPIVFIDTGYHFPETYQYLDLVQDRLGVELEIYRPNFTSAHQEAKWGKLWEQGEKGHKKYHMINKIEPMDRALKTHGARIWISGLRRSQASSRAQRQFAEAQGETIKVYPILDWSDEQVEAYYAAQHLPRHPLQAAGYVTMGDWHSTRPPGEGTSREKTRFNGSQYECGLHLETGSNDFQI